MVVSDLTADNTWVKMYRIAFILGCAVSAVSHAAICAVFPPPHQYEGTKTHEDPDISDTAVENVDEKVEGQEATVAEV